jgi:hypothetical protein
MAVLEGSGFTVDGRPRVWLHPTIRGRPRWVPGTAPLDLEFVATDVPALGARRFRLEPAAASPDVVDDAREIGAGDIAVTVEDAGTLTVRFGDAHWTGLCAVEDRGDCGDTYDFEALAADVEATLTSITVSRSSSTCRASSRCSSGASSMVPRGAGTRPAVADARAPCRSWWRSRRASRRVSRGSTSPCRTENRASDHRVRLLFPTVRRSPTFRRPRTFDVATADRGASRACRLGSSSAAHVLPSGMGRGGDLMSSRPVFRRPK